MEGITGIDDSGDCLPSHPAAYARGRRLMTDEVLVVSEALRKGGVDQISVGDCHMVGTNIERERMPDGIEVRPIADLALVEAEPSFTKAHGGGNLDAVVLLGHHAGTPNPRAFCSHTFIWEMEVLLDGVSLSETRVYAQGLAAEGIPLLLAAGDRWMLEELDESELGSDRLVATKEGKGRAPTCRARPPPRTPRPGAHPPLAAIPPSCGSSPRGRSWRRRRSPSPRTCSGRSPTSSAPDTARASTVSPPSRLPP